MKMNLLSMFVVESSPRRSRDPTTARKEGRSHERPVYTMLTPGAIRRQYIPSDGAPTERTVGVHERRRHYRTLRSDRFKKMQGWTITTPATWVGPGRPRPGPATGHTGSCWICDGRCDRGRWSIGNIAPA